VTGFLRSQSGRRNRSPATDLRAQPVTRHLKMGQTLVGGDRFRHVGEWRPPGLSPGQLARLTRRGGGFAVGEHQSAGKKLARQSLESMTLNLRATSLEGEF